MQEPLKSKLTPETIDLVYHIIDWLYFIPRSEYNNMPYSKDDLVRAMNGLRKNNVKIKVHKDVKEREHA